MERHGCGASRFCRDGAVLRHTGTHHAVQLADEGAAARTASLIVEPAFKRERAFRSRWGMETTCYHAVPSSNAPRTSLPYLRSDLKPARISSERSWGCSHAAK